MYNIWQKKTFFISIYFFSYIFLPKDDISWSPLCRMGRLKWLWPIQRARVYKCPFISVTKKLVRQSIFVSSQLPEYLLFIHLSYEYLLFIHLSYPSILLVDISYRYPSILLVHISYPSILLVDISYPSILLVHISYPSILLVSAFCSRFLCIISL